MNVKESTYVQESYRTKTPRSRELYERASKVLPSGSTRTVLHFYPYPFYARTGKGARLWDEDGNEYVDYCFNYSVLLLGHNHPKVISAVEEQLSNGTTLGTPTRREVELAERVVERLPSMEMVRFTPSGTEAMMNAVRLARAYTHKDKILKFEGAFHGTYDAVWISVSPSIDGAGDPERPNSVPEFQGSTRGAVQDTLVAQFNDPDNIQKIVSEHRGELAAIIVEPIMAVAGCITPRNDFLKFLREITEANNILLVFDEIVTGFRLAKGGAQEFYGINPDITTFGKVVGGGFPIGGLGASREIMSLFDIPEVGKARIPASGTFNAHPITMAAGLAVLGVMSDSEYAKLNAKGEDLRNRMRVLLRDYRIRAQVNGVGSLFHILFAEGDVTNFRNLGASDKSALHTLDLALMSNGIYFPHLHWANVSVATTKDDLDQTMEIADKVLAETYLPRY